MLRTFKQGVRGSCPERGISNASQAGVIPTLQDKVSAASIRRSPRPREVSVGPLTSAKRFLNVDDECGVPQAHRKPRVPACFLAAPLLERHGGQGACVPLASPGGEARGIQPLLPEQAPETSRLGAGICALQDATRIVRCTLSPRDLRRNLGIGRGCWGSPMWIGFARGSDPRT